MYFLTTVNTAHQSIVARQLIFFIKSSSGYYVHCTLLFLFICRDTLLFEHVRDCLWCHYIVISCDVSDVYS